MKLRTAKKVLKNKALSIYRGHTLHQATRRAFRLLTPWMGNVDAFQKIAKMLHEIERLSGQESIWN
jgi:hypothetical protein